MEPEYYDIDARGEHFFTPLSILDAEVMKDLVKKLKPESKFAIALPVYKDVEKFYNFLFSPPSDMQNSWLELKISKKPVKLAVNVSGMPTPQDRYTYIVTEIKFIKSR